MLAYDLCIIGTTSPDNTIMVVLEPVPSVIGREAGYILERWEEAGVPGVPWTFLDTPASIYLSRVYSASCL